MHCTDVFKLIQHNSQCLIWDVHNIFPNYNYIQDMNSVHNVVLVNIIVSQALLFIRMLTMNTIMVYSI